jgi:3-deoxy-D-manno-octulosonic-acid transferase
MSRLLYSLLFYLAMPLVWLRLFWRARRQPEYLQHLGERHGFYPPAPTSAAALAARRFGRRDACRRPLIDSLLVPTRSTACC